MNFKNALNKVKKLLTVKGKVRQYFLYAAIILAVFSLVNGFLTSRANTQLAKEKADLEQLNEERAVSNAKLTTQLAVLLFASGGIRADIETIRLSEVAAKVEIELMEEELRSDQDELLALTTRLNDAHETLAGIELKNSFLGERITEELYNYFPESDHLFFSETQDDLFRTNPATANAIYAIITENAVRIQIIGSLTDQVEVATDLLEQTATLVTLKEEEVFAYEVLVREYDDVFDNLEAALSLERQTTSNLERQISIMNRKNFFQKVLPSLNVVLGPYYDPFRNQGGFAVALGLGWRF